VIADSVEMQRQSFDTMKFVEFLEFLGRCAATKYKGEDRTMEERLELLLDELLPCYGLTRIEVLDEEEEFSESDPDY